MEALKEIGFIAAILVVVYFLTMVAVHLYWKWRLRRYDKACEKYAREVEAHQANMRKESKSFAPKGKDADRSEAFSSASQLAGSFGLTSEEASSYLSDKSPSFEGFGSGGSFGGGGASGSWDSGSDSSSSYDSGSSDSSSYND